MTQSRAALLAVVAALALAVPAATGCEPLRESAASRTASHAGSANAVPTAGPTGAAPSVPPSVAPTPTIGSGPLEASRGGGRSLSPDQVAAMTQARMSVSDGEIMRQLANTAERIAQQLAAGGPAPAPSSIHPGTNRALGYRLMTEFGWPASQWPALDALWYRESGWNQYAENRSSGAYGIPQSLPANKMAAVGPDWRSNPVTQIRWGLAYIGARYGSPQAAWAHSEQFGWY